MIPALGLIKSYWKPIAVVVTIIGLFGAGYYQGYKKCQNTSAKKELKEITERVEDYIDTRDKNDEIIRNIRHERETNPKNDERDSCLLSNDPLSTSCY